MPALIKASLATIVPLVAARLTAVTGVGADNVLLVARDAIPKFEGDQDILIRLGPPRPHPHFEPGVGRFHLSVLRILQVTPRTRRSLDMSDRNDYSLLADDGHLAIEESVIDALHTWPALDSSGNWTTQEPIHWAQGEQPVHETPVQQGWVHTDLQFLLHYRLPETSTGY